MKTFQFCDAHHNWILPSLIEFCFFFSNQEKLFFMGNKIVLKGGTSRELKPRGLFYVDVIVNKILYLDVELLKRTSTLSEDGKRKS